jgi:N6-L-threonylcarbamoyladenine synthase
MHSKFGGVVPEVAARAHVASIRAVVEKALSLARESLIPNPLSLTKKKHNPLGSRINPLLGVDYIAVTSGPGLIMSLLVGVEFAKALSFATGIPLVPVNHMEGHLYSPFGEYKFKVENDLPAGEAGKLKVRPRLRIKDQGSRIQYPLLSVVVSGGHTLLVLQRDEKHYQVLGSTVDDAAGEAFDKVAKLLDLPYPGGPEISKLASQGEASINFPRPMLDKPNFDFSFSGLKTAVLYYLQEHYPAKNALKSKNKPKGGLHHFNFGHIPEKDKANIARSFEEAVCDVLVSKAMRAVKKYNCKTVSLSGGVAANKRLRSNLEAESAKLKAKFLVPDFKLCTDNAEMIAIASYMKLRAGYTPLPFYKTKADASWEI